MEKSIGSIDCCYWYSFDKNMNKREQKERSHVHSCSHMKRACGKWKMGGLWKMWKFLEKCGKCGELWKN